jgi:Fe-S-cluster containining protein
MDFWRRGRKNKVSLPIAGTPTKPFPIPELSREILAELEEIFGERLNEPGHVFEKLELVYAFITKVNEQITPYTSCRSGCSHCCRIGVQITSLEAAFIAVKVKLPISLGTPFRDHTGEACVFLRDNGECGIYTFRPIICRTYHSLSEAELCSDLDGVIAQYGSMAAGYGNVAYRTAVKWVQRQDALVGKSVKDIRDFFPYERSRVQQHLTSKGD